jgi:hypothetical protein
VTIPNHTPPTRLARFRHATLGDHLVEGRRRNAEVAGRIFAAQSSRPSWQGSVLGHRHSIDFTESFDSRNFYQFVGKNFQLAGKIYQLAGKIFQQTHFLL